jgi:DNA-binding transcriptional MerR regulator
MQMTIQEFALKTGLPPTTLRFYENKKLLLPAARGENGYRYYSEEQISIARLIQSFRQSSVPMDEIRLFLQSTLNEQDLLLEKWRQRVEDSLNSLQIAKQYLKGLQPGQKALQMVNWEHPSVMIWFNHSMHRSPHPYHEPIELDSLRLSNAKIDAFPDCYVRLLDARAGNLQAEIGYRLQHHVHESKLKNLPSEWHSRIEQLNPTLFVTLESETADKFMCMHYMRTLLKHGFKSLGPRWDRYEHGADDTFLIFIPVNRMETD